MDTPNAPAVYMKMMLGQVGAGAKFQRRRRAPAQALSTLVVQPLAATGSFGI